jgi:PKD repeat protein
MKKNYTLFILLLIASLALNAQSPCPGNLVTNSQFTSNLTSWSQYGATTTAMVLPSTNGCLNQFLALQATNNSSCGVSQAVTFKKDTCYQLCYCVEFPMSGALFNTKLVIAAITPGITVAQLLSGAFTATQAQIIDVVTGSVGFSPVINCPAVFTASGNFTDFVIVNQTIGNIGTDVRIDNLCLTTHPCSPSCANVNASFTYVATGNSVQFTDNSTSNPGDVLSYVWDFGDPPSGPNNTSTLQNPTHLYPGPGVYFVCMYLTSAMTNGLSCQDTFCIDVVISASSINEIANEKISVSPNPAGNFVMINGLTGDERFMLMDELGQMILDIKVPSSSRIDFPSSVSNGLYFAIIQNDRYKNYIKLFIHR